jgi:hypothetical protein
MKQRIDANGNVIEARKEGIGAPKVSLNTPTPFYNAAITSLVFSGELLFNLILSSNCF